MQHRLITIAIVLLFSIPVNTFAQESCYGCRYDSLMSQLELKKTNAEKIRHLVLLVDLAPEVGPADFLIDYLQTLTGLNKKARLINSKPYELMYSGYIHWREGRLPEALKTLQESVKEFDKEKKIMVPFLSVIRVLYSQLNQHEERLKYYTEKLNHYALNGPRENMGPCYHAIAGYHGVKADYNLAISNYLKAAEVYKKFYPWYYNNELGVVGAMYVSWGNLEKGEAYLKQVLPLHKAIRDSSNVSFCLNSLVNLSRKKGAYKEALEYGKEAMQYAKAVNAPAYTIAVTLRALVLLAMKKPDMALPFIREAEALRDSMGLQLHSAAGDVETDFARYKYHLFKSQRKFAESFLLKAYQESVDQSLNNLQLEYLDELVSFYKTENPAKALHYATLHISLFRQVDQSEGAFKVAQFETEQKEIAQERHIQSLKQEQAIQAATLNQRNIIIGISFGALALVGVSMFFLYRQLRLNKKTLASLRETQKQLILSEKMASLGELTAGIAHEIQNPLNFINNFSEVSMELLEEMEHELSDGKISDAKEVSAGIRQNLAKITHHGKRADGIVKSMLEHSRTSNDEKQRVDINAFVDEYLRLSYHGLRAKDKSFNAILETHFDPSAGRVSINSQEMGRVLLNLFSNAFYSVNKKKKEGFADFDPTVAVTTRRVGNKIEVSVKDNGIGIPEQILNKIYQPFFTTKPTGEGTGLGLSLSYDIITKGHSGVMKVQTKEGEGAEFSILLPA